VRFAPRYRKSNRVVHVKLVQCNALKPVIRAMRTLGAVGTHLPRVSANEQVAVASGITIALVPHVVQAHSDHSMDGIFATNQKGK
jgi:hypothetical protein